MNKKVVIPVAIILIIAIVVGVFLFVRKDSGTPDVTHNPNNGAIADSLDKEIEIMTRDEIKDVLDTPTNDEKDNTFQSAIDVIELPDSSTTEVKEDGNLYTTTEDGTEVKVDIDQGIFDKTDEEAEENFDEIMQRLEEVKKTGTIPDKKDTNTDTQSNTTGTTDTTSGNSNQPAGSVWDQTFYDTLTPEQQTAYKNADDATRTQMKSIIEANRQMEQEGYQGEWEQSPDSVEESWSHVTVN